MRRTIRLSMEAMAMPAYGRWLGWLPLAALLCLGGCGSSEEPASPAAEDENATQASARPGSGGVRRVSLESKPDPHPLVVIHSSLGNITLELDAEKAPLTVSNFLAHVDEGHYNGTIFHYVCEDFVMGGGFTADLKEKKSKHVAVRNEADNGLKNVRGTISMARFPDVIDSGTCRFFLNVGDHQEYFDHVGRTPEEYGYCVFGKVVNGFEVVEQISKVKVSEKGEPPFDSAPEKTVLIKSVTRKTR